ncbi:MULTISPECIES: hypothetical protein [unclassified Gilliamella]|uniref:hypothetical protein n=1 Tax=unclassified Gilliamella TaxID=2685620 RepID=UPI00130A1019|nr:MULTISPECIES: hypothetical protein [unclassified Gilliamella]MWP48578.1 hypothetical protein [Gilliamella sp. Lep-s35]MWP68640.1 hypothetical protein [Gilliamella sp. Lep-s5]MWP76692.1 hypothetical protein [Gilliamella sp. Lep-s21]
MKWIDNNLIDDKNKYLVGFERGGDCCDWADITVYDNDGNDITDDDLTDWEFCEFPYLLTQEGIAEIAIVNKKLGVTGHVYCQSSNNGDSTACYWAHKTE